MPPQANVPVAAVLFDYGMVLTGPADPASWTRMREITGLDETRFHQAYWAPRHGYDRGVHTGADYWRAAGRHAGITLGDAEIADLLEADVALWTQPNPPMIAWAQRLQAAGTRTGILSNLGDAMTAGVLASFPWLSGFDHLLWSHTLHLAKPEPAIYAAAAKGLKTLPAHILFVDDREDNVTGAQAAGMQTIRYTTQHAFEQEMEARNLQRLWLEGR